MKRIFLFVLFFGIGISSYFVYTYLSPTIDLEYLRSPIGKTREFRLEDPPPSSLKGTLEIITQEVLWQSRTASIGALLLSTHSIQQGETISTNSEGTARGIIQNVVTFSLKSNSEIEIIQTLPSAIVFLQKKGEIAYLTQSTTPVSVRCLSLLTSQKNGEQTIAIDEDESIVTVQSTQGEVTVAYNDTDNITRVITVSEGETYVFDDTLRVGELLTEIE